ncbi:acyl-CoA thioesterase [Paludisphaera rhizosphaerae]|uniref:acyl-CoA thioesterase n=1 Tax=Paludisphaera rhizosphaerae TaxID=2711216 RepID=UPI0013ECC704|nr:acyl-CoA thioesterase [Paludisphaera rhizosphaerae]
MDAPRNEDPTAPRAAIDSRVSLSILTVPGQANPFGTLHGGVMLRMADECGAVSALRHVGKGQVTTAAMDSMTFLCPVYVGERVEIVAEVTHAGRTSIETQIEIYAEALQHPGRRKVGSGYALYVALDDEGRRPHEVPPLLSVTEADRLRDEAAAARQAVRLARREEAKRHKADFL